MSNCKNLDQVSSYFCLDIADDDGIVQAAWSARPGLGTWTMERHRTVTIDVPAAATRKGSRRVLLQLSRDEYAELLPTRWTVDQSQSAHEQWFEGADDMSHDSGSNGRLRVMFIEDDPEFVELYRFFFEGQGYAVETAPDGPTGLAMVRERRPDLLFLDIRMPGLNGIDVLRELRSNPSSDQLPVVILSNYEDPELMAEARRLGALHWLVKTDATPRSLSDWAAQWVEPEGDRSRPR